MTIKMEGRQPQFGPTEDEREEKTEDQFLAVIGATHAAKQQEEVLKNAAHRGVNKLLQHMQEARRLQLPLAAVTVFLCLGWLFDHPIRGLSTLATGRLAGSIAVGLAVAVILPEVEDLGHWLIGSDKDTPATRLLGPE